jgi:hypothetical protein
MPNDNIRLKKLKKYVSGARVLLALWAVAMFKALEWFFDSLQGPHIELKVIGLVFSVVAIFAFSVCAVDELDKWGKL